MTRIVDDAKRLATAAHDGQFDKSGQPYIGHPARVAARTRDHGGDDDIEVVAWLHDVVEDTDVTLDVIEKEFGPAIARAVDAITRRPDDAGDEYYHRVAGNRIALAVKRSDIEDNLDPNRTAKLDPSTRERLAAKYAHALAVLDGKSTT
jgi:(p)ppGpp synthase/HD superfamily hydrolase